MHYHAVGNSDYIEIVFDWLHDTGLVRVSLLLLFFFLLDYLLGLVLGLVYFRTAGTTRQQAAKQTPHSSLSGTVGIAAVLLQIVRPFLWLTAAWFVGLELARMRTTPIQLNGFSIDLGAPDGALVGSPELVESLTKGNLLPLAFMARWIGLGVNYYRVTPREHDSPISVPRMLVVLYVSAGVLACSLLAWLPSASWVFLLLRLCLRYATRRIRRWNTETLGIKK